MQVPPAVPLLKINEEATNFYIILKGSVGIIIYVRKNEIDPEFSIENSKKNNFEYFENPNLFEKKEIKVIH